MIRPLGTVEQTAQGLAVVQSTEPPELGAAVVDDQLTAVGTVVDVFGPTAAPYCAITPADGQSLVELLGKRVYVDQRPQ